MSLFSVYLKFPNRADCISHLEKTLWVDGPACPYCQARNFTKMPKEERYHCNTCNKSYSVTVGTMFHKTKVDLQKWFYAISLISNNDNMSARKLAMEIDVTKDTAWFMMKRIKETLLDGTEIPEPERPDTPEPPM